VKNVIGETLRDAGTQGFRHLTALEEFPVIASVRGLKFNQRLGQRICQVLQCSGAETCVRNGGFQLTCAQKRAKEIFLRAAAGERG
jgi:hypothetical protein